VAPHGHADGGFGHPGYGSRAWTSVSTTNRSHRSGVQPRGEDPVQLEAVHGGIVTGHGGGAVLVGLRDRDGIEVQLCAD